MMMETVLVVDDDLPTVQCLTGVLEHAGYRVRAAADGQAVRLAREIHPAVILLDVAIPGADGVEIGRRLHADPRTAGIPVIAVSGADDLRAWAAAMEAVDYLAKPFDLTQVLDRVDLWSGHALSDASAGPAGPPEWNKRPSPTEVRERFDGGLDDGTLAETVAILRADPNWHVACSPGCAACTLHLVYSPTGEVVRLALRSVDALWRQENS